MDRPIDEIFYPSLLLLWIHYYIFVGQITSIAYVHNIYRVKGSSESKSRD